MSGRVKTKPQAAHAEERIGLAVHGKSRHRLVAAGVECPDGDRALARPAQNGVIGLILRLLIGQSGLLAEQKFGAHQPDAVGILRIRVLKILDALDIDQQPYLLARPRRGGAAQNGTRRSPVLAE